MIFRSSRQVLLEHLAELRTKVQLKKKYDRENASALEVQLNKYATRHATLGRVRIFVFVLLYASLVSTLGSISHILGEVINTITYIGSIVGVGILSLIALYITWRMSNIWNRMLIIHSHLVAIYEKNNKGTYSGADLHHPPRDDMHSE